MNTIKYLLWFIGLFLHSVCYGNNGEKWDLLILSVMDGEASVHEADARGYPPLHTAVYNSLFKTADQLLALGADINQVSAHGRTPLNLVSCYRSDFEAVKWLTQRGADLNLVVPYYGSPLKCAETRLNNLNYILESAKLTPSQSEYHIQARAESEKIVAFLKDHQAKKAQAPQPENLRVGILDPDGNSSKMVCPPGMESFEDCQTQ